MNLHPTLIKERAFGLMTTATKPRYPCQDLTGRSHDGKVRWLTAADFNRAEFESIINPSEIQFDTQDRIIANGY